MQMHRRYAENQVRWIWTEGLRTLGQQEMAVRVSWPEHDLREQLLTHLLYFIESYLIKQSKRILSGQTLRYGWTLLHFVSDDCHLSRLGTDVLLIEEMQDPFSHNNFSYISGVAHALALLQVQNEAMRRNVITGEANHPHRSQQALVCTRITPETIALLRPLRVERVWEPDVQNSGWFIGCCDQEHDHDHPHELALFHLLHLVERFPGLFPYLAMPVGTMLLFEENRAIIFRPGEDEGQIDPGSLLSSLP
jgi:hypothetical protein